MIDLKRIFAQPLKVGAILGGVFGFISDFLQPIAEVGYIIATGCVVAILITLIMKIISPVDNFLYKKYSNVWYAPMFFTLVIFSAFLIAANYASLHIGKNQQGIIATKSTFISKIQKNLMTIEESLSEIQELQKEGNKKLDRINNSIKKSTEEIRTLKKETSDNPRKELTNLGIEWNYDSFRNRIINNDSTAIILFLKGGMKYNRSNYSYDARYLSDENIGIFHSYIDSFYGNCSFNDILSDYEDYSRTTQINSVVTICKTTELINEINKIESNQYSGIPENNSLLLMELIQAEKNLSFCQITNNDCHKEKNTLKEIQNSMSQEKNKIKIIAKKLIEMFRHN